MFTIFVVFNNINYVVNFPWTMENINQLVRFNYARISDTIQNELIFLSELAKVAEDERFKQSIAEVIYQLNDLSDAINLQRRSLNVR